MSTGENPSVTMSNVRRRKIVVARFVGSRYAVNTCDEDNGIGDEGTTA